MGAECRRQQETAGRRSEAESPNFLSSPSSGVCDYWGMLGLTKILVSSGSRLTRVVYRHPKTQNFMNNLASRWCSGTMLNEIPSAAVASANGNERCGENTQPLRVSRIISPPDGTLGGFNSVSHSNLSRRLWDTFPATCGPSVRRSEMRWRGVRPQHHLAPSAATRYSHTHFKNFSHPGSY